MLLRSNSSALKLFDMAEATRLPGRLHNPGNLTLERQAAEAETADAELAQKRPRTSAQIATVMLPR